MKVAAIVYVILTYFMQQGLSCLKKVIPLSSTKINAGSLPLRFSILPPYPTQGIQDIDFLNIVLSKNSSRTSNRAKDKIRRIFYKHLLLPDYDCPC